MVSGIPRADFQYLGMLDAEMEFREALVCAQQFVKAARQLQGRNLMDFVHRETECREIPLLLESFRAVFGED